MELPDFLKLPPETIAREKDRQDKLRQDFNSRARLSPAEAEAGRFQQMIPTLEENVRLAQGPVAKAQTKRQLAEAYAGVGEFLRAGKTTPDEEEKAFYKKASKALDIGEECACVPPIQDVAGKQIKLPKYRVIKEANSFKHGQFGYLVECSICGNWTFLQSDPIPDAPADKSDIEALRA